MSPIPSTQPQPSHPTAHGFPLPGNFYREMLPEVGQSVLDYPELEAWCIFSNIQDFIMAMTLQKHKGLINQRRGLNAGPHLNLIHSCQRFSAIQCLPELLPRPSTNHCALGNIEHCHVALKETVRSPDPRLQELSLSSTGSGIPSSQPGRGSSSSWPGSESSRWCDQGGQEEGNARVSLLAT